MTTIAAYVPPAPQPLESVIDHRGRVMLWQHRGLIAQMTWREVVGRYKGSVLGLAWSLLHPLFMLAVYTFAFGFLWKVAPRGESGEPGGIGDFALFAFAGMSVFGIFSESVNRATTCITHNPSFVKKVVFPLEILPITYVGTATIHAAAAWMLLMGATWVLHGELPWTIMLAPFSLLPLLLFVLGFSWILAAVGAYVRDATHITAVAITALIYVSPVFYSVATAEARHRGLGMLIRLNPLTVPLENFRAAMLGPRWGGSAAPLEWTVGHLLAGGVIAAIGYRFFQRAKRGFADVV